MERRSFLDTLLFTSFAAAGLTSLAPIPFYLVPPKRAARRVLVGKAADLAPGAAKKFDYGGRVGIALNDGGTLRVLDARCTHQGCKVNWEAARAALACPCHGAVFAPTGAPIQGPHHGPLAAIPFRVTASGDLEVGE